MATARNSTKYTNIIASPPVYPEFGQSGGRLRVWQGTSEASSSMVTDDYMLLDRVPFNCRPFQFWLGWDDLGTTATMDLGWYYPNGTAGDTDEFASGLAGGTATVMTNELYQAAAANLDRQGKTLWEHAGLSVMPLTDNGMCDLGLTFTSISSFAAGTVSWVFLATVD